MARCNDHWRPRGKLKVKTTHLTAQHLKLMPQDRDLHIFRDTGAETTTEDI